MSTLTLRRPSVWTLAIAATVAAGTRAAADIDSLRLSYDVHVNGQGWIRDVRNGDIAGGPDRDRTLSAVRFRLLRLVGEVNPGYSVCYRVFLRGGDWTDEVCDGAVSGLAGGGAEITALRVRLASAPGGLGAVCYATHRLSVGWDAPACDGAPAGLAAADDPAQPLTALYGWVWRASEARGYHTRSVRELTTTQLRQLASALRTCTTHSIIQRHEGILHDGEAFFLGHRAAIRDELEPCLRRQPGSAGFLPLPYWGPGEPIPAQLQGVKELAGHPAVPVLNPDIGRLRERSPGARHLSGAQPHGLVGTEVCNFSSGDELFTAVAGWHSEVHYMVEGNFGDPELHDAPTALIFWPWHAYLDNIYALWRLCGPR